MYSLTYEAQLRYAEDEQELTNDCIVYHETKIMNNTLATVSPCGFFENPDTYAKRLDKEIREMNYPFDQFNGITVVQNSPEILIRWEDLGRIFSGRLMTETLFSRHPRVKNVEIVYDPRVWPVDKMWDFF